MKVVHLLNTNKYSGAENVACQIIKMTENTKKLELVYCSPNGEIANILEDKGISYIPLEKMSLIDVSKMISKYNPDIIHAHDFRATCFATVACILKKTRVVSHIHSDFDYMSKLSIYSIIFFIMSLFLKEIIWVSENAMNNFYFSVFVRKKSIYLKNVIDTNEIKRKIMLDNNNYSFDLVYVGRLSDEKNPMRLLEIFNNLYLKNNKIKLGIVGDGGLKNQMEQYVRKNKLEKNIVFLGFMKNPFKVLNSSKLMMMTSKNEGLPMCILESFSCGVPVVSTKVGAIPLIIENNYNGYCSNDDSELVEYIYDLLNDSERLLVMKKNAKQYLKDNFNENDYKEKILNIYGI